MPEWTLENPYKNPLNEVTFNLPFTDNYEQKDSQTAEQVNPTTNTYQWVEPENSLQWQSLKNSVQLLSQRKNRLFVLVGPFNEHTIESENIGAYQRLISEIELWLKQNNIPYLIPQALPPDLYIDASHPNGNGYTELAKQLYESPALASVFLANSAD